VLAALCCDDLGRAAGERNSGVALFSILKVVERLHCGILRLVGAGWRICPKMVASFGESIPVGLQCRGRACGQRSCCCWCWCFRG